MNADTIERARAAVARLRVVGRIKAGMVDATGERAYTRATISVDDLDALLALAEAVVAIVDDGGPTGEWWDTDDGCLGCGEYEDHAPDCPVIAVETALAALADHA